jgi:hypothetical protein
LVSFDVDKEDAQYSPQVNGRAPGAGQHYSNRQVSPPERGITEHSEVESTEIIRYSVSHVKRNLE